MGRRRPLRPSFSHADEVRLVEALREARDYTIRCSSAERHGSPRHLLCEELKTAIDRLAGDLTGNPEFYHLPPTTSKPPGANLNHAEGDG